MLYDPNWKAPITENKFLSARKLRISTARRDALIKTLEVMEGGGMVHFKTRTRTGKAPKGKYAFNMNRWPDTAPEANRCGSAACIGGNAEFITGVDFENSGPGELRNLFFPSELGEWSEITVKDGAQALRNYLTNGRANWQKVRPDLIGCRVYWIY